MALKKKGTIRRDKANKAVRSYFDASARKAPALTGAKAKMAAVAAAASTPVRADAFLAENSATFQLKNVELRRDVVKEGAASASVRYEQRHHGLPVYGAQLVVGLPKTGGAPTSAVNKVDYDLPPDLTPDKVKITGEQADAAVRNFLRTHFPEVVTGPPRLFAYRVEKARPAAYPNRSPEEAALIRKVTGLGKGEPGRAYLAYRIEADTRDAEGQPRGQKFSDADFDGYDMYLQGDVLATALWNLFLALGGSATAPARKKAADTVIRLYVEMLITAADDSTAGDLANGLLVADQALSNGVNKAAIKKAFKARGLTL